jgi:hypothetical protein
MAGEIGAIFPKIGNLNWLAGQGDAGHRDVLAERYHSSPPLLCESRRKGPVEGSVADHAPFAQPQCAVAGLAERRRFEYGVEAASEGEIHSAGHKSKQTLWRQG